MGGNELEVLKYYNRKIEKYRENVEMLLNCLAKLDRVHVNISLLSDTNIGRTVSGIKKQYGDTELGIKARDLVTKWKTVVAEEERSREQEGEEEEEEEEEEEGEEEAEAEVDDDEGEREAGGYAETTEETRQEDAVPLYIPTPIKSPPSFPSYIPTPLVKLEPSHLETSTGHRRDYGRAPVKDEADSDPDVDSVEHERVRKKNKKSRREKDTDDGDSMGGDDGLKPQKHKKSHKEKRDTVEEDERSGRERVKKEERRKGGGEERSKGEERRGEEKRSRGEGSGSKSSKSSSRDKDGDERRRRDEGEDRKRREEGEERKRREDGSQHRKEHKSSPTKTSQGSWDKPRIKPDPDRSRSDDDLLQQGCDAKRSDKHFKTKEARTAFCDSSSSSSRIKTEPLEEGAHSAVGGYSTDSKDLLSKIKEEKLDHRLKVKKEPDDQKFNAVKEERRVLTANGESREGQAAKKKKDQDRSREDKERERERRREKEKKRKKAEESAAAGMDESDDFARAMFGLQDTILEKSSRQHSGSSSKKRPREEESSSKEKRSREGSSSTITSRGDRELNGLKPSSSAASTSNSYEPRFRIPSPSRDMGPSIISSSSSSSLLPEISPLYKPLPRPPLESRHGQSEEEALGFLMGQKNKNRSAVYSGKKRIRFFQEVPSLFELCIMVLQDHVEDIDEVGDLNYSVLQPVLERAQPKTLMHIEDINQHLMEDTAELWKKHCIKEFRNKEREEMESWREMYERCTVEREEKLDLLKGKVKKTYQMEQSAIRQTKMAYPDMVAKPPREVARQQAKNGTGLPVGHAPRAGASGAKSRLSDPTARGDRPPVVRKPKQPPMMAKVKNMMKGLKGVGFGRR